MGLVRRIPSDYESTRDGNAEIYVMNADGSGDPVRLTNFPGLDTKPSWSPLGDRIAFHAKSTVTWKCTR
jgi:Tol biopolymer transport system component